MARLLRSSCAAAPTVAAAGSNEENSGNRCEESRPALNANPGICCEVLPPEVPENNSTRIANPQTKIAVIHAIRTATRPVKLASLPFRMTSVWSRCQISGAGDRCPGVGQMATPQGRSRRDPADPR